MSSAGQPIAATRAGTVACVAALWLVGCAPDGGSAPEQQRPAFPEPQSVIPGPLSPLPEMPRLAEERVQLGRALFSDPRLSSDGSVACASCHDIARGGADPGVRYSRGVAGRLSELNTPTVLNAALNTSQFWDGRARTLEEQVAATLANPAEMDNDPAEAAARLRSDGALVADFEQAYPKGLSAQTLVDALATYVRALTTPDAPFDRYLRGEAGALGDQAVAGHRLFLEFGCVSCHQGVNLGGNLFQYFGVMGDYFADRGDVSSADYGRYNVTGRESDRFRFKVPGLRNVAERPPYFHDGSAATLDEAVRLMVRYQLGRRAGEEEVGQLVAFLEALSAPVPERLR